MKRHALAALAVLLTMAHTGGAGAGQIAGIAFPDTITAFGTTLHLNGMALRTYSVFDVHIYVAGLYLPQPSHDPEAVINSAGPKVINFRFLHDVDADKARDAWKEGFEKNCSTPCDVRPDLLKDFLAGVVPLHKGDSTTLGVDHSKVVLGLNGRTLATIDDAPFSRLIMRGFIGQHPASPKIRTGLMGMN